MTCLCAECATAFVACRQGCAPASAECRLRQMPSTCPPTHSARSSEEVWRSTCQCRCLAGEHCCYDTGHMQHRHDLTLGSGSTWQAQSVTGNSVALQFWQARQANTPEAGRLSGPNARTWPDCCTEQRAHAIDRPELSEAVHAPTTHVRPERGCSTGRGGAPLRLRLALLGIADLHAQHAAEGAIPVGQDLCLRASQRPLLAGTGLGQSWE